MGHSIFAGFPHCRRVARELCYPTRSPVSVQFGHPGSWRMLKITGQGSITTCDGITRRDFLQAGTLGALGFTLSHLAALQSLGAVAAGHDERSVILIFNLGAPSQLDTWDMKPDAPRER